MAHGMLVVMSTPVGRVATAEQQQHVLIYRKLLLRKRLLRWAPDGAAYVPFIGDGDIATHLYGDRAIYGADLDPERVLTARSRLPHAQIRIADCDSWPFPGLDATIAVCDFDAYVDPYRSFRSFWRMHDAKADRMVLFFTDGRRQGLMRTGSWTKPDGEKVTLTKGRDKMTVFNSYLAKHIWPWFYGFVDPWRVLEVFRYQRGMMVYWAAALERPK